MSEFLANILYGINSIIGSYGWSMILFTLLVKLIILPLDYKSRKGMRGMTRLQPEMAKLQKKYANDKEKLNQKTAELYRREGVSPMSGCLPMIVSMVVLWFMWSAMRLVANTELVKQCVDLLVNGSTQYEGFLWIRNIWMPDSPFTPVIPDQNSLMMIQANEWSAVFDTLNADQLAALALHGITDVNAFNAETVFAALQTLPAYAEQSQLWSFMPSVNLILAQLNIYAWFVLPILSAVTQILMTKSQPQSAPADPNSSQAGTQNFMKYFFPLFSLWICSSYNALFSLYWVISNVFSWVQSLILNKVFENMEKKEKTTVKEGTVK